MSCLETFPSIARRGGFSFSELLNQLRSDGSPSTQAPGESAGGQPSPSEGKRETVAADTGPVRARHLRLLFERTGRLQQGKGKGNMAVIDPVVRECDRLERARASNTAHGKRSYACKRVQRRACAR